MEMAAAEAAEMLVQAVTLELVAMPVVIKAPVLEVAMVIRAHQAVMQVLAINFPQIIFIMRVTQAIRRDDLAEQAGCSVDTVKRTVRLLKRFNLLDTTREGYMKKPKFNKFLRRFARDHQKFFAGVAWTGARTKPSARHQLEMKWSKT